MCACDEGISFVCSRCAGTPLDYRYWLRLEPESSDTTAYRIRGEYVDDVIEPALRRAA